MSTSPAPDTDALARLRPTVPGTWRVLAFAYGFRTGLRGQHFLGHDERSTEPHPTAYYVWLAVSDRHVVMVDAGIGRDRAATMPGMSYLGSPVELLAQVGVTPDQVDRAVLTHLHYDHTGTVADLPAATYVVQETEWQYWTGPWPQRITRERWLWSPEDLAHLGAAERQGRLQVVDGDVELLPGLSLHLVGGHTAGMQVVRLRTGLGHVVLASDASHFYENLGTDRPAPLLHCTTAVHGAFDRISELADRLELVVPGHDPAVLERHPAATPALTGRVVQIA
ncbi:N-acyl homoserine lactonase family protein [Modestobacter versicolor]|uniref:Glyoxylase-like metal-dependent hydrolase (Beta-lactamase superfamily II) n=1 Tax=Modestobacter versicolor TaxID=429133 RepID=A0A839XXD6_9ACTN|nr:N-acyl homoserine lactonase family protein [Modestobacter versicolor]MBB3674707.1 glyoxylase-like metal-dependent hydrolase (beta-lactamase superfamily II) [Modestobacter versicolor]